MSAPFHFDGFRSPRYTQVPDELFDVLLPRLKEGELKVLLYIVRRTFGFKKDADTISLKQMVEGIKTRDGAVLDSGTGLSRPGVTKAVKGLMEKGIITAVRNRSEEKGDQPTTYALRVIDPVVTSLTRGGVQSYDPPRNDFDPQETVVQQIEEQETDSNFETSNDTLPVNASRAHEAPKSDGRRMSLDERAAWEARMDAQESYLRQLRPKPTR